MGIHCWRGSARVFRKCFILINAHHNIVASFLNFFMEEGITEEQMRLRALEARLRSILETLVPQDLSILKQLGQNISELKQSKKWDEVKKEQRKAHRTLKVPERGNTACFILQRTLILSAKAFDGGVQASKPFQYER